MDESSGLNQDFIFANGERIEVSKEECSSEIERVSRDFGMNIEDAWEQVKNNLQSFIERGERPVDWVDRSSSIQHKKYDERKNVSESAPAQFLSNSDSSHVNPATPAVSHENSNNLELEQPENFELSDDLLPDNLRKMGMSIQEAITKGLFKLDGEHPDAELLRKAYGLGGGAAPTASNEQSIKELAQRQLKFPFKMPQNVRIIPTDFNQTSLFHVASNNVPRRFFKNEIMGKIGESVHIYAYGEEMRHDDELLFMQLVHIARGKAPLDYIYIDNVPLIRGTHGITRKTSAKDTLSIDESLARMRGAYVTIVRKNPKGKGRMFITINLIKDLQGINSERRIMIDPCMVALLDSYTAMDQELLFKTRGVARQLFKYLATKPFPGLYPILVTSFFELCYGSLESLTKHYLQDNPQKTEADAKKAMTKKISDFRRKALPDAIEELKNIGVIVDATFDDAADKISIVKKVDFDPS